MYCVLIIPALRSFEEACPGLQNRLAEMAVPASPSIKLAVSVGAVREANASRLNELGGRGLVRVVTHNKSLDAALELVRDHSPSTGIDAPVMYEAFAEGQRQ